MADRQRTARGFVIYDEFPDTYDCTVRVQESSAVDPHCWLCVEGTVVAEPHARTGKRETMMLHLAPDGVERLMRALGDYLQDQAERDAAAPRSG